MDSVILRQVQLVQLEIAKEIKRVCDENNIIYFLDSGTLLGAIRHKGFIPWDDDMDIGMLRGEYNKFIEVAPQKLGPDYFLQTWKTDEGYPYAFAKVRKKGTVFIEAVSQKMNAHNEIFVDVFPYDVFPDDSLARNRFIREVKLLKCSLWMKDGITPWLRHDSAFTQLLVRVKYVPYCLYAKMHTREWLISSYEKIMPQYNTTKSRYYVEQSGGAPFGKWLVPSECLHSFAEASFEDTTFRIPYDYDLYLKEVYGEYMQLPPAEKRENRHQVIKVEV